MTPDVSRELTVSGGFGNEKASTSDPKAFTYEFDDNTFPNIPLIQPRLNSVEEWTITNLNNDEHPMHIHVNDFQVTQIVDPIAGTTTGVQPWGQDNVNVPAPVTDANENALEAASVTLRTEVHRVHRHFRDPLPPPEPRGQRPDGDGQRHPRGVDVRGRGAGSDRASRRPCRCTTATATECSPTVTPFPAFEGTADRSRWPTSTATWCSTSSSAPARASPRRWSPTTAADAPDGPFTTEIARFAPFDAASAGGVSVAGADIDGNALADNIIVGSGPGMESAGEGVLLHPADRAGRRRPEVFSSFTPYPGSQSGVTIATGMVDAASGRASIVTAPGPGRCAAGQDVPLRPVHADRRGRESLPTTAPRARACRASDRPAR